MIKLGQIKQESIGRLGRLNRISTWIQFVEDTEMAVRFVIILLDCINNLFASSRFRLEQTIPTRGIRDIEIGMNMSIWSDMRRFIESDSKLLWKNDI